MPYLKSVCKAGKTKEIERYYTKRFHPRKEKRAPKQNKTTEKQQAINDRLTERKLTRVLNANFDSTSWYLTHTYKKEERPPDIETLHKQRDKLIADIRKLFKAEGKTLKYVETVEVGERGAVHIHMIINDIDIRKIRKLWKYGFVHATPLDNSGQYRKLAKYFIKYFQKTRGTSDQIQKKAYNCSRNLIRPEPEKKPMKGGSFSKDRDKIRVPKGWYLDKESIEEGTTEDGYEFFRYTLIRYQEYARTKRKRRE